MWARVAALACAVLLTGCTLSESLRHDDIRSVWAPANNATAHPTVIFATDREPDGSASGYGLHWSATTHCGRSRLSIPAAFRWGAKPDWPNVEAPSPIVCDGSADMGGFAAAVATAAKGCGRVLLFVHGYNTTFRTALLRAGQIATDTQWRCAAALFSWSSEAKFDRYAADIERSGYAVPELIDTLRALAATGLKVEILAHSMGVRPTLSAIAALCGHHVAPVADQLILAAPDVSAEHDNDDFAHFLKGGAPCVKRTTIYASDNDLILAASEGVHGGVPRAGRVPLRDLQYAADGHVDVVDASAARGDPLGHAYFLFSFEMMDDLMWTLAGLPIAARADPAAPGGPTLRCAGACADGHYVLKVADSRGPDFKTRLLRHLWPLIFRVQ
ncbi:MAG TPA: alpha/beta hydrolase [Rhizomicrobium sp.]|nr:alpha/beta hydrolase [Rhizomicrobium sp.]